MKRENNKKHKNNKKSVSNNENLFKYILTSLLLPIIIGSITAYITFKMDKPKEYVVRESFNMDKFKTTEYFPLKVGNYWVYERDILYRDIDNNEKQLNDRVKKEIINHYNNQELDLFVLKGDPLADPFIKENPNEIVYGYIVVSNKVIKVNKDKIESIIEKVKDKKRNRS